MKKLTSLFLIFIMSFAFVCTAFAADTDTAPANTSDQIINIVFAGIDQQENRADSMMVLSVNVTQSTINLVSLLRDTTVSYPDFPIDTKLGYAYKWGYMGKFGYKAGSDGGNQMLLDIINSNFGTNYEYYLDMYFETLANVVNYIGGVDIVLDADEAAYLKSSYPSLKEGTNHLNGIQALQYARIRHSNDLDSDYNRALRQQKVVLQIFNKLLNLSSSEYLPFIRYLLYDSGVVTNLSLAQFVTMSGMDMSKLTLDMDVIPNPDYETDVWGGWVDVDTSVLTDDSIWLDSSAWNYIYDLDAAGNRLRAITGLEHEHVYKTYTKTKEENCTEYGEKDGVCFCGTSFTTVVEPWGHTPMPGTGWGPWCLAPGMSDYTWCWICQQYVDPPVEVPALGHDFQNYVSDNNATYFEDGTKTGTCPRCGYTDTIVDEGSKLKTDGETLIPLDGVFYYFDEEWVPDYYGYVDYAGGKFFCVGGRVDTTANGLAYDPENRDDWYYLSSGQVQTGYSGLALYDDAWFYVVNGKLDTKFSGLVDYDGGKFIVAAGQIQTGVNGLWQNSKSLGGDDKWYFFSNGQAQTQYTGLAYYDNEWFYVVDGELASSFNGTVQYDGETFTVVAGMVK